MAGAGPSSAAPPLVVAVVLHYLTDARDRMHLATLYRLKHRQAEALVRVYDHAHGNRGDDAGLDDCRERDDSRDGSRRPATTSHCDDPVHSTLYYLSGADAPTWIPPRNMHRRRRPISPPRQRGSPRPRPRCALEAASARSDPAMLDFLLKHAIACLAEVGCDWVRGRGVYPSGGDGGSWRRRWKTPVHLDQRPPLYVASEGGHVAVLARWASGTDAHNGGDDDVSGEGGGGEIAVGLAAAVVATRVHKDRRFPGLSHDGGRDYDTWGHRCVVQQAMRQAATHGQLAVLQWWWDAWIAPLRRAGRHAEWTVQVDDASAEGHVAALRWLRERGIVLDSSTCALDRASMNGHSETVAWWLRNLAGGCGGDRDGHRSNVSRPDRWRYTERAVDGASAYGHVAVLQVWGDSGLHLRYTKRAVNDASRFGHVAVLDWWKRSGLSLRYTDSAFARACENGHVNVLQWWKDSGLWIERYRGDHVDRASASGQAAVLQWLKATGLPFPYTCRAMNYASGMGHVAVLQWWKDSGCALAYTEDALRHAVERREMAALNWWSQSGLPLKYSSHTVKAALNAGLLSVLYQWRERERTEERRSQGDEQEVQQQHDPSSADAGAGAASDNVETAIVDVGEVPQIRAQFLQELEELGSWVASFPPELPFSNYRPMSPTYCSPDSPVYSTSLRCTSPTSPTYSPTSPTHSPTSPTSPTYSPSYWLSSPVEPTASVFSSVNSPTSPTTYL